jgi:hypothetical protein
MARPKKNGGEIKLVRRNTKSGEISARKRGRPGPDFEIGYLDAAGEFKAGDPPKRRGRRGRKPGPKPGAKLGRRPGRPVGSGRKAGGAGGLSEIELIVRREVDARLKAAREAAIGAFNKALGL